MPSLAGFYRHRRCRRADATPTPMGGFFANWRQNIIYIGFVLIFVVFAVTLSHKGLLNPTNLFEHHPTDCNDRRDGGGDDLCAGEWAD